MTDSKVYSVDWVANILHEFPHIDFQFAETNSTFDPGSTHYQQSIIFLAALSVVFCILLLLLTSFCLCVHCCCKSTPTKKKSTTCIRFIVALFIIFAIGSVAVGFFGNEEGNKGVQSTVEALQDTNDTLRGSLVTLGTLNDLSTKIAEAGVNTLKKIFGKHLSNATVRNDVLKLADEIKNKSQYVKSDIDNIKSSVSKISLDQVLSLTQDAEFYRWMGTIVFLCLQLLVLLVYIFGMLKKSKYWIVWGITLGFFSLFLSWVVTGVYLGGAVAASDFCMDPDAYVISQLDGKIKADIISSYVECKNKRDPQNFSKALDDARFYVTEANNTLNLAINKTLRYNISQFIAGPVKLIRDDLTYAQGNITSLGNTVYCGQIHSNYVKALNGICNRSLVGVSLILVILPVLGLSLMFIQCLAPRVWLYLGTRKTYRKVDDSDPFLPRPPPYNTYGTMGDERVPLSEPTFLEESASVMPTHPRTESIGSDSPPPANFEYYPGSFVEQYNNMGTFPRSTSQHN